MEYDLRSKRIHLSEDRGVIIPEQNSIEIEGKTFYLKPINKKYKTSKGGNSSVFCIYDPNGEEPEKAIKISNYYKITRYSADWIKRRYGRFINEIDALKKVQQFSIGSNIVSFEGDGFIKIGELFFPYYLMEKSDSDLKEYLLNNPDKLDFQERVRLCRDIFNGIKSLHELDFYHRDIKPDNVLLFFTNEADDENSRKFVWKIGDLGLVAHRENDYDDVGEKIGPIGWLSPEAMNKLLTEEANLGLDCKINEDSDIFQMGKLFWFIFDYNVPIGQIKFEDFKFELPHKKFLFDMIFGMIQYPKERRFKKETIKDNLELLSMEFGI